MNDSESPQTRSDAVPAFDPTRAAQLRASVLAGFRKQMRFVERYLCISLVVALGLAVWSATQFFTSAEVSKLILYAVIFLALFETTVLLKLWYWIVNNKLNVLREIKMLRLEVGLQKGASDSLEAIAAAPPPAQLAGLSKAERWFWKILVVLLGMGIGLSICWPGFRMWLQGSEMTSQRIIRLNADGTGRMETTYRLPNTSPFTLHERAIYHGGSIAETQYIAAADSPWSDAWGVKLPVRVEPAGANVRDVIRLNEPVPPGTQFTLRSVSDARATRSGDGWTFTMQQDWGYHRDRYFDTVVLPAEAVDVQATPEPVARETQDGHPVLKFEATRTHGASWKYEIRYRLSAGG